MSAASVRPWQGADCLIRRSAVDVSHARQQGNPCSRSSVTCDPVRGVIINGLGAGAVGGVAIFRCPLAGLLTLFAALLSLLLSLCHWVVVSTCRRQTKHRIVSPLGVPQLAVPHLA